MENMKFDFLYHKTSLKMIVTAICVRDPWHVSRSTNSTGQICFKIGPDVCHTRY